MKRRAFLVTLGSAVAWPLVASAQPGMPVIGFLHSGSAGPNTSYIDAFRLGLNETGYMEGRNVQIEYRWAEGQFDKLPDLAVQLVQRPVTVLVAAGGTVSVLAATHATSAIPIIFPAVDDPVKMGIVQSFNRPGGNATGVSLFNAVLTPKRFELLRELMPSATSIALLVNPKNPSTESQVRDAQGAIESTGLKLHVLSVSTEHEIDAGYATLTESHADLFLVGADPLFQTLRNRLIALAARYAIPSIYLNREFPLSGGLMSYGIHFPDAYRQAGKYTGRV